MNPRISWAAFAAACILAASNPASAQITPPNIRKPIDAAKKAADATSAGIQNAQKVGADPKQGTLPAAATQAGGKGVPSTPQEAASMRAAAARRDTEQKAAAADSASRRGSASQSGSKGAVFVYREEYTYADEGRRDPFLSLMGTGELTPLFVDLTLIGVMYDVGQPSRSIAVLVDGSSNLTYRVKAGETLGRMKVEKVERGEMTVSIDEFGFSRREVLPLDMTSRKAGAAPGRRP
jgi:hypothetical protein